MTITILLTVLSLVVLSTQMSVRRQLDSLSTSPTSKAITTRQSSEALISSKSNLKLRESFQGEPNKRSNGELHQSVVDADAINQILDLLRGDTANNTTDVTETSELLESQLGSLRTIPLTTGNPKVDKLLADLGEPTENSKAIWMALLHGLMSDGSLNELLGNFIQEMASSKREDPFIGQDGEEQLEEEQVVDQLEGAIPQTQMGEFILEPHLGPAIMPFELPKGFFVAFLPRRAFGVVNGVARPAHGHGSFYIHRPPGLVDVINPPAYGFLFNGYRRFEPDAVHFDDHHFFHDEFFEDEFHYQHPEPEQQQ